jgi:Uma2 family endonuclease
MEARRLDRDNYTREEYIALLETTADKIEYHNGKIMMMAGAKGPHNRIVMDLTGQLYNNPNGCKPHGSDQALSLPEYNKYLFPDLMFVCDEDNGNVYEDESEIFLMNPCLIIEVLSKKTAEYDRTPKFTMYRSLPTFREYILIDSRRMQIEAFYKEDEKGWIIQNLWKPEQQLTIHTLGTSLTLTQIYQSTGLQPVEDFDNLPEWLPGINE